VRGEALIVALSWAASPTSRQSTSITHELVNLNLELSRPEGVNIGTCGIRVDVP
jgi:hypothetical protein